MVIMTMAHHQGFCFSKIDAQHLRIVQDDPFLTGIEQDTAVTDLDPSRKTMYAGQTFACFVVNEKGNAGWLFSASTGIFNSFRHDGFFERVKDWINDSVFFQNATIFLIKINNVLKHIVISFI